MLTNAINCFFPLGGVAKNDAATFVVVAFDTQFLNRFDGRHTKVFVDLMFNRQPVAIPAESSLHVPTLHGEVAWYRVLQDRTHQVAVVR